MVSRSNYRLTMSELNSECLSIERSWLPRPAVFQKYLGNL